MKRAPIFLALLLSAAVTVGAQDKKLKKSYDQDGVWWSNWEDGVKEAQARNVGIHFTVHKDN